MNVLLEKAFIGLQFILPHHALSRLMGTLTQCRIAFIKNLFIENITRIYDVNLAEAQRTSAREYTCFNDFFTRALSAGARPICKGPGQLASPADGAVSQLGTIDDGNLIQAKGRTYSLSALLGRQDDLTSQFAGGHFLTIYLSPRDYHRLHMPMRGELRQMLHIPGRLFSVNDATARGVDQLFARNERVVAIFDTAAGPMALILVGAIFVASIETVWHGIVTPPHTHAIQSWDYPKGEVVLDKGAEMGRFNMGSTIIVLLGKDRIEWALGLAPGSATQVGAEIGHIRH